jgi:DNA-binding GntR family transcriptional regulator
MDKDKAYRCDRAAVAGDTELEKPRPLGAPEKIAEKLREMIARGVLYPGTRLGQAELAAKFNTSRVPLREGLKLLTSEGIVQHDPNRGFFIALFSSHEAEQLFRMRHLIEDELLRSVVWPNPGELKKFSARANRLEELLNQGDRATWWAEHRDFHNRLFDLSPDKLIVREAMRLWLLTDRYRAMLPMPKPGSEERRVVEKESFIDALKANDREKLLVVRRERRKAFERLVMGMLRERDL